MKKGIEVRVIGGFGVPLCETFSGWSTSDQGLALTSVACFHYLPRIPFI